MMDARLVPGRGRLSTPLECLGAGVEADDRLEVPNKLPQPVHVRVDILLHPLLHRVWEIDAFHVRAEGLDEVLPVLVDSGGDRRAILEPKWKGNLKGNGSTATPLHK